MILNGKNRMILPITVAVALTMSLAFAAVGRAEETMGGSAPESEYATKLFGTDIISIEVIADKADWQGMLDNAINEEYIMVDVVVNGTKFTDVGIRPKGNSSLTQVANSNSDRYSFRLQFDEYVKGQTCFGLDSFVVNNMLGDNTYMKEYVSYELMREIGVDAPYFGYANIKVNGENWGLYLAVERYSKSYEQRVFKDTSGMLYNVKTMDINGGGNLPGQLLGNAPALLDGKAFQTAKQIPPGAAGNPDTASSVGNAWANFVPPANADGSTFIPQMRSEIGGMERSFGGRGGSGGSLEYTGDDIESYGAIFDNVVGKGTASDFQRVVQALKALSEGEELEKYFDIDRILRYLAAHTIVVNLDSYSSSMAQNYYIYEREGRITILPWDYNLAWGGFQSGSASSVVNFPIDTPLSGVEMASRPLIDKLFDNAGYLEKYHSYLQQLIDGYFADNKFKEKIGALDALISDYVKNDATAFCTYEEYKTAISAFNVLGDLRAQSVQGQLNGSVPSTTTGQNKSADQLIPAGNLKLSDLGSMMGGKAGNNNFPEGMKPR